MFLYTKEAVEKCRAGRQVQPRAGTVCSGSVTCHQQLQDMVNSLTGSGRQVQHHAIARNDFFLFRVLTLLHKVTVPFGGFTVPFLTITFSSNF